MPMELVDLEAPVLTYIFHIHVNVIPVILEEANPQPALVSCLLRLPLKLSICGITLDFHLQLMQYPAWQ